MTSKPLAFAYVRFSSEAQSTGSSVERQLERAQQYAAAHGLELDDTTYREIGAQSAFKGKNAVEGKLGLFIDAVEKGRIPKGSYLLVENFDRMSRNVLTEAQSLLLNLVNHDIIVVTISSTGDTPQVFSKATINSEDGFHKMIIALLEMVRARKESERKADLVSKGWESVRSGKKQRPIITRMAPAWLSTKDGEKWIVDEAKAKVVRSIFQMAHNEGLGSPTIMKRLNDGQVPTLGGAKYWTAGIIIHILKNKAVIGVLETPKIPARPGYFPEIVKPAVFDSVQLLLKQRNFAPGPRATGSIVNLFAGRSYCGLCGEPMKTVSKNAAGTYLHCTQAYGGSGCDARRVAYYSFETQLLRHLMIVQKRPSLLPKVTDIDPTHAIRARLEGKQGELKNLLDLMVSIGKSDLVLTKYKQLEVEIEELKGELRDAAPIKPTSEALNELEETFAKYKALKDMSPDEQKALRQVLQVGLRNTIARIDFHHLPPIDRHEHYRVTFLTGTVREWMYERPVQGFQPGNKRGKRNVKVQQ